ncbi:MAG: hypothetical protein B6245_21590 [Desulfobacteraceae bacterium 4572_88]|nr:MAG: hypothetical protein B6245_21590 [Desulfobacteraceae bacterium 4572_88]
MREVRSEKWEVNWRFTASCFERMKKMKKMIPLKRIAVFLLLVMTISVMPSAKADEMLSHYGLKGYTYTYSPRPVDGFHIQMGAMYSLFHNGNLFHDENLNCRDGYIWVAPLSFTYGDGDWWEVSAATHWESWENTDFDAGESGLGDLFLGGKALLLSQEKGMPLDLALMPYVLIPTGNRDKWIGDLTLYNTTDENDLFYGVNLLLGHQWRQFYLAGNAGFNYAETDIEHIEAETFFFGITLEYQIDESFNTYLEFVNTENKNQDDYSAAHRCHDENTGKDMRELGLGLVWVKGGWGLKFHLGGGLTATSPDIRVLTLINRSFSF